jgi:hypothetical protein
MERDVASRNRVVEGVARTSRMNGDVAALVPQEAGK